MKSNLLVAVSSLFLSLTAQAEVFKTLDSKDVKITKIANGSGDVLVKTAKDNNITVEIKKIKFADSCKISADREKDSVIVKVDNKILRDCQVDLTILVPKEMNIDASTGSGDIKIEDIKGEVEFKVGSGNVNIAAESPEIEGASGSGDIDITGLIGSAELRAGSGNIKLQFPKMPTKGSLSLKTGSGNISVLLPKDAKIKTKTKTGSGDITNQFDSIDKADFSIDAMAGSGNISLKKN